MSQQAPKPRPHVESQKTSAENADQRVREKARTEQFEQAEHSPTPPPGPYAQQRPGYAQQPQDAYYQQSGYQQPSYGGHDGSGSYPLPPFHSPQNGHPHGEKKPNGAVKWIVGVGAAIVIALGGFGAGAVSSAMFMSPHGQHQEQGSHHRGHQRPNMDQGSGEQQERPGPGVMPGGSSGQQPGMPQRRGGSDSSQSEDRNKSGDGETTDEQQPQQQGGQQQSGFESV